MSRGGRPRLKKFRTGDRVPIGCRVSVAMRRKLDEAVKLSGRSFAQELEYRLERSFDLDAIRRAVHEAMQDGQARRDLAENLAFARTQKWVGEEDA